MKAVIFDCFGVLYLSWEQQLYEQHTPDFEHVRPRLLEISAQHDYGFITKNEANQAVAELLGITLQEVERTAADGHQRNNALIQYSQTLRRRYKVGLLSNISRDGIERYLSATERATLFDATVLSGDVGLTKPHPHIFTATAEALGVPVSECVMIDDLQMNCAGADAAGMRSIHYQTNRQTIRDLEKILHTDHDVLSTS